MTEYLPVNLEYFELKTAEYLPVPGVLQSENDCIIYQYLEYFKLKMTEYLPVPEPGVPQAEND